MNVRNTVLAALIFVTLYNLLFFHTQPGLGTGLLFFFLNVYFFAVKDEKAQNILAAIVSSIISIVFAFLFSFRASGVVQLVDIIAASFFSLLALYLFKYQGKVLYRLAQVISFPLMAINYSTSGFFKLFKADSWSSNPLDHKGTSSAIRGLIYAAPILIVLFLLLTQADPVFNKLTQNLISNLGERTLKSLLIFIGLLGLGLANIPLKEHTQEEMKIEGKGHELAVITGLVLSLFAAFILVQFQYLFSSVGERELAQLGINSLTYSEYVRKGFFELLVAASIACGLLLYNLRYFEHLQGKLGTTVHLFSSILTLETGFLLLSAVKRLVLYADAHGLTRARVFGFIFLIWLGILLAIFLFRLLKKMKQQWFSAAIITATLLVLLLVNLINVDGSVATLYKPTVNGEIDYYYLASLSPDAAEAWQPAIEDAVLTVSKLQGVVIATEQNRQLYYRNQTLTDLQMKIDYLIHKYGSKEELASWEAKNKLRQTTAGYSWQAFNISEYLAYKEIVNNLDFYKQIFVLLSKIADMQSKTSREVINNTPLDRSTQPPLVR